MGICSFLSGNCPSTSVQLSYYLMVVLVTSTLSRCSSETLHQPRVSDSITLGAEHVDVWSVVRLSPGIGAYTARPLLWRTSLLLRALIVYWAVSDILVIPCTGNSSWFPCRSTGVYRFSACFGAWGGGYRSSCQCGFFRRFFWWGCWPSGGGQASTFQEIQEQEKYEK